MQSKGLQREEKLKKFFHNPATSGVLLMISTIVALLWANLAEEGSYHHFWHHSLFKIGQIGDPIYKVNFHDIVNDFFMAIFFFMVGLEIKREIMGGELSSFKKAIVPVSAAIGGMIIPALMFTGVNLGLPSAHGWGVPMATDIAFSLGVLALLGSRVPLTLKVFLTALAIGDDLGAVIVIAVFYTESIDFHDLLIAGGGIGILLGANWMGIRSRGFYYLVGILVIWMSFIYSGVHATIAGILVALTVPARRQIDPQTYHDLMKPIIDELGRRLKVGEGIKQATAMGLLTKEGVEVFGRIKDYTNQATTVLQSEEQNLHPVVNFFIMPVFALANAGVEIPDNIWHVFAEPVFIGIGLGLIVGKLVGVVLLTKIAVMLGLGELPNGVNMKHIIGIGFLAGMGFTMSLFISNLAFTDQEHIEIAKIAILLASMVSGIFGYIWLFIIGGKTAKS